jgi:hypothetical protein
MRKFLLILLLFVSIAAISLQLIYPQVMTRALNNVKQDDDEADLPSFLKQPVDKAKFFVERDRAVAERRGLDFDEPASLPDPRVREEAIALMERQEERAARSEAARGTQLLATWTPIGPAPIPNGKTIGGVASPVSGRVTAIAVHPTNPNIVYVGTPAGGLYRSLDGGLSWTPLFDGQQTLLIGAVAIAPSQPDTIYVGTGDGTGATFSFFGVGVYRIDNASASPTITGPLNKSINNADVFTSRSISQAGRSAAFWSIRRTQELFSLQLNSDLAGSPAIWETCRPRCLRQEFIVRRTPPRRHLSSN